MVADHDAIFGEQSSFGRDLHSQHIGPVHTNKFRDIKLKAVVHADNLRRIRDFVPVEPDIRSIVNAFEDEGVQVAPGRRRKGRAIPPVLLPKVSQRGEIHAVIQILVNSAVFEHLQDCCGHVLDPIPAGSVVTFLGDQSFIPRNIVGGGYSPAAFQFSQVGRLGRGESPRQKHHGKTQHELYARMFPLHGLNIPFRSVQPFVKTKASVRTESDGGRAPPSGIQILECRRW